MFRHLLWLSALLISGLRAESVHVAPALKTGQIFRIQIEKSLAGPAAQSVVTTTTPVQMTVREAGPQGSKVEWLYGETKMSGGAQLQSSLMQIAAGSLRNLRLELALTPEGKFKNLTNAAQVEAGLTQTVNKIIEALAARMKDPNQQQQLRQTMRRVLEPGALLSGALRDVQLLLSLSGVTVQSGRPAVMNLETAKPLGTPGTVKSRMEYVLEKTDGKLATVRLTQTFDPVQLGPIMEKIVPGSKAAAPAAAQTVMITDVATFRISSDLGLPGEIQYERLVKVGTTTRSEMTRIHLSPA